jgi:hypothetical protein
MTLIKHVTKTSEKKKTFHNATKIRYPFKDTEKTTNPIRILFFFKKKKEVRELPEMPSDL